ncbi:MAG: hypothetical protein RBR99_02535 [Dehalococcoidales bacterium]|jgi:hypothetical protein|nr:hypothetical protein [Dehalococcoidales bacterium]MDX9986326.1 hypothetical protein [Dehalococcoidales bacterium]NLE89414.1 hypothetical protein [Dehalococcoidales bacterium]
MVPHPGKTPRVGTLKYVNCPEPIKVTESKEGLPGKVGRELVEAIKDHWRIDDEWWRNQIISRIYFAVVLTSGRRLVIYKDSEDNCWYRQQY